ncbi:hypothetical protein [Kitasatospora camelliae]|uniref:Uncharacterized protein n=1 Tax=Kitasatospora camelliae TaxID=3156397 RepID=A0AAU8K2S5_9ACTN
MTSVKPKLDASERAARDLLNRKVREGIIDRRSANEVLKVGLPFVRHMLATWRREGTDPQWITGKFQAIHAEALQRQAAAAGAVAQRMALTRVMCAELYLAVWAGLQEDYAAFVNERRSRPSLPA